MAEAQAQFLVDKLSFGYTGRYAHSSQEAQEAFLLTSL